MALIPRNWKCLVIGFFFFSKEATESKTIMMTWMNNNIIEYKAYI